MSAHSFANYSNLDALMRRPTAHWNFSVAQSSRPACITAVRQPYAFSCSPVAGEYDQLMCAPT